jgi:hypothetical protein
VIILGAEPPSEGRCERLARLDDGEAIDSVWPPALVQPSEEGWSEAVRAVQHSSHAGEVVCANVAFARLPYCLEGKAPGQLGLQELEREALELRVGGTASDVFAPREAADGCFGDDTTEDEDTSEVVEEDPKPSAEQQGRDRCDKHSDTEQLSQRGAGAEQGRGKGAEELQPPLRVGNHLGDREARWGCGREQSKKTRGGRIAVSGVHKRARACVAGVAGNVAIDTGVEGPGPDRSSVEQG